MSPKVILLADNDEAVLRQRTVYLEARGFHVITAPNPEAAERELTEQKRLDAAIIDIRLRDDNNELDFSGFQVLQHVPAGVPRLVLTNWPTKENVRQVLRERGQDETLADDIVGKSEGPDAMMVALQRLIRSHPIAPGAAALEALQRYALPPLAAFVIILLILRLLGLSLAGAVALSAVLVLVAAILIIGAAWLALPRG